MEQAKNAQMQQHGNEAAAAAKSAPSHNPEDSQVIEEDTEVIAAEESCTETEWVTTRGDGEDTPTTIPDSSAFILIALLTQVSQE